MTAIRVLTVGFLGTSLLALGGCASHAPDQTGGETALSNADAGGAGPSSEAGSTEGGTRTPSPDAASCSTLSFRARSDANGTAIAIPPAADADYCIGYHVTAAGQFTAFTPVIDNPITLHHFGLFQATTPQTNGTHAPCETAADDEPVFSWEPGTGPVELASGSEIPLGTGDFVLRVHYVNMTDETQEDASGLDAHVCP